MIQKVIGICTKTVLPERYSHLLTAAEVANKGDLSTNAVYVDIRAGKVITVRYGKHFLIDPQEAERYIESRQVEQKEKQEARRLERQAKSSKMPSTFKVTLQKTMPIVASRPIDLSLGKANMNMMLGNYSGETAAQAVEIFSSGGFQLDAVKQLKISFEAADHMWKNYQRLSGSWILSSSDLQPLRELLLWRDNPPTISNLTAAIMRKVETEMAITIRKASESMAKKQVQVESVPVPTVSEKTVTMESETVEVPLSEADKTALMNEESPL